MMATAPHGLLDPAIYVGRRDGRPTLAGSNCSDAVRAKGFVSLLAKGRASAWTNGGVR
jgi:hypothetical protein